MTYYVIKTNPVYNVVPIPINWYGKVNVDDICREQAYKIADRQVLAIEERQYLVWVDLLVQPFPMVSELVKKVMRLYLPHIKSKQVILLNSQNEQMKRYFIPILPRCSGNFKRSCEDECELAVKPRDYAWVKDMDAFYVKDTYGRLHILASLFLVESILRRGAKGIWLDEIKIIEE